MPNISVLHLLQCRLLPAFLDSTILRHTLKCNFVAFFEAAHLLHTSIESPSRVAIKAMGAFIVDLEARRARARRGRGVEPVERRGRGGRH